MSQGWQGAPMVDTISDKQAWQGFKQNAQQLCDGLDDNMMPSIDRSSLPSIAAMSYPTTEQEVSMACRNQFAGVNTISEMLSPSCWSMIESGASARRGRIYFTC